MSIALHGIGLGGGIAIGHAYIVDRSLDHVVEHTLASAEVDTQIIRFLDALHSTRIELEQLRGNIPLGAPTELAAFLSLNIMMLSDSQIAQAPIDIISSTSCNAEWAIKVQSERLSDKFSAIEDKYLQEKKHDVIQILERVFKNLDGHDFNWQSISQTEESEAMVLVTRDMSPADLLQFKSSNFVGFINDYGSLTSHTTIVGRNLESPAVVAVANARQLLRNNEIVIVDGIHGVVIINPDIFVLNKYQTICHNWYSTRQKLLTIRKDNTLTVDGMAIELLANIESDTDVEDVKYNNAAGIGLFRSEFLFINANVATEEEQFTIYAKVAAAMKNKPVTIRTADLGADKNFVDSGQQQSNNPALGLTGIRLSLTEPLFFRQQLRAILRASIHGKLQIMFPMVSAIWELKQALQCLSQIKQELTHEHVPFDANIAIGVMIEIPSAAIAINGILGLVDFISIGTNDLIQYLLAVDRNDELVSYLYDPLHPAVLSVIYNIIRIAHKKHIPVSICGEMAGDIKLTRLLLGMGLRKFSMYSANILNVKHIILSTNVAKIQPLVKKILHSSHRETIYSLLEQLNT